MQATKVAGLAIAGTLLGAAAIGFLFAREMQRNICLNGDPFHHRYWVATQCALSEKLIFVPQKEDAGVYAQLGEALYWTGLVDQAVPHFQRAIQLDDNQNDARIELGWARMRQGAFQESVGLFQEAYKHNPKSARVAFALGFIEDKTGNKEKAIVLYEQALAFDPDYFLARNNLAAIYEITYGDSKQSLEQFDLLLAAGVEKVNRTQFWSPSGAAGFENYYDETLFSKATALSHFNRQPEAVVILESLLKKYPNMRSVKAQLAYANISQEKYDKGIAQVDAANKGIFECNCGSVEKLQALLSTGRDDEALKLARDIISNPGDDLSSDALGTTYYYKGTIERRRGDAANAFLDIRRSFDYGSSGLEMGLTQLIQNRFYEGDVQDKYNERVEPALQACMVDDKCMM